MFEPLPSDNPFELDVKKFEAIAESTNTIKMVKSALSENTECVWTIVDTSSSDSFYRHVGEED